MSIGLMGSVLSADKTPHATSRSVLSADKTPHTNKEGGLSI